MQRDAVEPFPDNWAYLRAELAWLDRILSLAIARQRQETQDLDRTATSRADRVSSHWWKGLVNLNTEISSDSPVVSPRRRSTPAKGSLQQQLEAKIQATQQQGIPLALPSLCQRLQLSLLEKQVVVMALAPEMSRRYGRIYNYLQETEPSGAGLPTVDLLLRLLCPTDADWRLLHQSLAERSLLIQHRLLHLHLAHSGPLLAHHVKLAEPLVTYLLSNHSEIATLEALLHPATAIVNLVPPTVSLSYTPIPPTPNYWSSLVLPAPLIADLHHLCHRVQFAAGREADHTLPSLDADLSLHQGVMAFLTGAPGTGKMRAAKAIAQTLQTDLVWVDLAVLHPLEHSQVLRAIVTQAPKVLLLRSAHIWCGRGAALATAEQHQFRQWRLQTPGVTLLSTEHTQSLTAQWRRWLPVLEFPLPRRADRLHLWQQALHPLALDTAIDWNWLARQPLTGGEIQAIAQDAAIAAAATHTPSAITLSHLKDACRRLKGTSRRQSQV